MKKTLIVFASILLGLFIVLSVLDKSEYRVERNLWHLQRQLNEIARDPSVVPPQRFEDLAAQYRRVVERYPDSRLTHRIDLVVGQVYMLKQDYVKARVSFNDLLTKYPDDREVCAQALNGVAKSYEADSSVQQALKTYNDIIKQYPLTREGLNTPLYIAHYYVRLQKEAEAKKAYQDAVNFYKKISQENKDTITGFRALRYLAIAYLAQNKWEDAVQTLGRILSEYPSKEYLNARRATLLIRSINWLSLQQLKNYDIPKNIYMKFMKEHPDHELNGFLKKMVESLDLLKQKGITVLEKQQ